MQWILIIALVLVFFYGIATLAIREYWKNRREHQAKIQERVDELTKRENDIAQEQKRLINIVLDDSLAPYIRANAFHELRNTCYGFIGEYSKEWPSPDLYMKVIEIAKQNLDEWQSLVTMFYGQSLSGDISDLASLTMKMMASGK